MVDRHSCEVLCVCVSEKKTGICMVFLALFFFYSCGLYSISRVTSFLDEFMNMSTYELCVRGV